MCKIKYYLVSAIHSYLFMILQNINKLLWWNVSPNRTEKEWLLIIRSPFSNQVKKNFMVYGHFLIYPKDLRED